jgi:hypothetical protein
MDARTATTVAASPAIATLAPNLQQSTLDAFEQLRCELGALDAMSPMASPLATLDGNLPRMLGASPALHKAPGGGLQLSFRKTVSTPVLAEQQQQQQQQQQEEEHAAALRTSSAYPDGMASTRQKPAAARALTTAGTAGAFTWAALPAGDEGLLLRTHSPPSAPASPPDMPAEVSSPQLEDKLSQDAAMLDAEVLRVQHSLVEKARRDADARLLRVQTESAARLAAVQRESEEREAEARTRAQEQVEHAQRVVRMEMQQEIERTQNDTALRLRRAEQQSSEHVAAYQQQAFEMVRKATQSSKAQAEELVADAQRQAEQRLSDALKQCDARVHAAETVTQQTEAMLQHAELTAERLLQRLVGKQLAVREQRAASSVLHSWHNYTQTRRREESDGAKAIHARALQARVHALESAQAEHHRASSVEHVRQQRERIVSSLCQRRARGQQKTCFETLSRFADAQRALSVASYRAVVWRQEKTTRRALHAWKNETEAMAQQVASYLAIAAAIVPDAFARWVAFAQGRQVIHRVGAKWHRRRKAAVFRHWRQHTHTAAAQRAEAAQRRAEVEAERSTAAASLAASQSAEHAAAEACAEAEQRAWAEAAARSAAEAQVAQLSARLSQHMRQLERAQEEARGAEADARAAEGDVAQIRAAREAADAARREESAALQAVLTEAVEKEGRAVSEAEAAGQALTRARAEESRLTEASSKQAQRVAEMQRALAEANEKLRSQTADIARLVSGNSESRAEHEATTQSLRSAVAALRDSLEAEQRRNTESEAQLAALSRECESLRTAVATLEATSQSLRLEAEAAQTALAEESATTAALRESWQAQHESHAAAMASLECSVLEQMRCEQDDTDALIEGRAERAATAVAGARRRQAVGRCFSAWARLFWMEAAVVMAGGGGGGVTAAC